MLVLTRKENESIRIGDGITLTVTRIQGNRVRFAIDAPKDVRITRGELKPRVVESLSRLSLLFGPTKSGELGYVEPSPVVASTP